MQEINAWTVFLIVSNISQNRVFNLKFKKSKSDAVCNIFESKSSVRIFCTSQLSVIIKCKKKLVDHAGVGFKLA